MNNTRYQQYWAQVEGAMTEKLELLKEALTGRTDCTIGDINFDGDEDFQLVLDLHKDDEFAIGAGFTLIDGESINVGEGFGIKFDVITPSGNLRYGYVPYAYSERLVTMDVPELLNRIEKVDIEFVANNILKGLRTA